MLDGFSLAPHSCQHVGRHSLVVSYHKRSLCGCFGRPFAQGSAISAFNPLAAQQCVLCRQGLTSSVSQVVAGATQVSTSKVYQPVLEGMGRLVCSTGCTKQCHICRLITKFFGAFILGGLAYIWYISFCYFCHFGASSSSQGF